MSSRWIDYVKLYANERNISFKDALSKASESYKKNKFGSIPKKADIEYNKALQEQKREHRRRLIDPDNTMF